MALNTSSLTALTGAPSAAAGTPPAAGPEAEQRFLKLLVTQLNNQDPLNPLDNAQLTSQLAQMSTVSGIEKLNGAFASLVAQSSSSQVLQSAGLIGRSVLVPGQGVQLQAGAPVAYGVELPQGAEAVQLTVTNAAGQVVRSLDLGALPTGLNTLAWDGLGDRQAALPDGAYTLAVTAQQGGAALPATLLTFAGVTSVMQSGSGVALALGSGAQAKLADVRQIQ